MTLRRLSFDPAGRIEGTDTDLSEGRRLLRKLAAKGPENWTYPGHVGRVESALAILRLRQDRAAEARQKFAEAVGHLETACLLHRENVRNRTSLNEAREKLRQATGTTKPEKHETEVRP
jgi:hypothetical protein